MNPMRVAFLNSGIYVSGGIGLPSLASSLTNTNEQRT